MNKKLRNIVKRIIFSSIVLLITAGCATSIACNKMPLGMGKTICYPATKAYFKFMRWALIRNNNYATEYGKH